MQLNVIKKKLDGDFLKFLASLEGYGFSSFRKRLIRSRRLVLEKSKNEGKKPNYLVGGEGSWSWKQNIPEFLKDQRNQMTGPADSEKLCVKMINSHSPGVMLDLEDSLANTPEAILLGHENIKRAIKREIWYPAGFSAGHDEVYCDENSPSVIFTRVRGLHIEQMLPNKFRMNYRTSASLFDLAYHFYDMDLKSLAHPPCIYIPKSESAEEAKWWRKVFLAIEKLKKWPVGTIKCMALVESHPLAYQMEEFAYNLRPYLVGFNLGRWDYMASLIDFNYNDPDWLFPDRNSIPSDVAFFQNLRHRMAQVCHKHGLLAIGGMTALYPSRQDPELNERALKVLKADKENEAACLMDGAWTGHPDQNEIAVAAFPEPNQLDKLPGDEWLMPNLRDFTGREGLSVTEEGTREAIRVCSQYRQGVLEGRGASLINGYMEDLATDRIYRIMIAQRIDHGAHTEEEVREMFLDEREKLGEDFFDGAHATWELVRNRQFDPE